MNSNERGANPDTLGPEWEQNIWSIFSDQGDFAYLLDTEGTIRYTSPGVTRLLGYIPSELNGRRGCDFIHSDDVAEARLWFRLLVASDTGAKQTEFRFLTAADGYRWLEVRGNIFQTVPTERAVVLICRDITPRKELEEALLLNGEALVRRTKELDTANNALERALRLKDEFLTCMSHELRTPLAVIIGQAEILSEEIHGTLNQIQHKAVRSVESSGRHLLALINDILDLSKIEAAMLELCPEPVNVEQLCSAGVMFIKHDAHCKRLAVSMTLDPAVLSLQADPRRIKQILVNLLANAVKFTPEGGAVGLEATGDQERHLITFTVWDTGVGIAPENLDRVFRPFVQVDNYLARRHDGTGLGLALVEQLAQLHGGDVTVVSTVGKGSRFTVTLPWDENKNHENERITLQHRADASETVAEGSIPDAQLILVVDDSRATAEMMLGYLQSRNYLVSAVSSGEEAVALARSGLPALILMDIQMPGMDGLEAIRQIRRLPGAAAGVPIIALTALAMQGDREQCLAAGADEYLSKPVSMKVLNAQIRKLLVSQH